ncbi:MAG: RES domain-containing protein [Gammaproteobacteria bacterium]|nr:RES domain-containing protein [Gammaproteobacteria bacterium]MYF61363.1 RES domain-containing protein [Gammaproteobacteria bacterium]MYI23700.1 RES domain-containing protein [Gammaproteobacteria bacterium]
MNVYRIHPRAYPALGGIGAGIFGGRWNPRGIRMVYASLAYEGAMLEQLAHTTTGRLPVSRIASRIVIPEDCAVPMIDEIRYPDWQKRGPIARDRRGVGGVGPVRSAQGAFLRRTALGLERDPQPAASRLRARERGRGCRRSLGWTLPVTRLAYGGLPCA